MKKNTDRALSILLALVMIISMLPVSAFAENDPPATGTDIAIENMDGKEEDAAKEGASSAAPGELPGTGENSGGEDKTAESTPTPEPSKAPAKQAAPAQDADDETPPAVGFTVTFDANGYGEAPEAVTVESGKSIAAPKAPEAEGFSFLGWFRDQEASVAWDFDKDTVTDNITLYAGWTENTPAPTRSGMLRNGGTKAEIPPDKIKINNIEVIFQSGSDGDWRVGDKGRATVTVEPEDACKDVIWDADPEGIVEIDKDGYFTIIKQHEHSGFIVGTIIVESRVDDAAYDYVQIGRLVPADSNYWSNAIEAVEISECPNVDGMWREGNEGQASVRWKSGVTPRTVTWSASHSENVDIEIDSDGKFRVTRMDSYAQQNFYITATFNVNGVDYSCRSNAIKVFKDKKNVTAVKLVNSPTKLSYVIGEMFDYTGLEVELTYQDGTKGLSKDGEGFHYQPGQDGDWWGPRNTPFQYGDNKVAITYTPYYGDSGTGTIIFSIQVSPPPTYPITLDANGGTVNGKPTDTATIGRDGKLTSSLPGAAAMAHPNDNMQFMGWYTEKSGGTAVDTSTVLGANATIYAQWKDNTPVTTHAVSYAIEGGSFAEGTATTENVKNGESPAKVPTGMSPDDDHKNIGAWYQDDGTAPVDPASVSITGTTTFTWKFEPKPTQYSVSVEADPAAGGTVTGGGTYTEGESVTVMITDIDEDYVFDGWYKGDERVTTSRNHTFTCTEDVALTARFIEKTRISYSLSPSSVVDLDGEPFMIKVTLTGAQGSSLPSAEYAKLTLSFNGSAVGQYIASEKAFMVAASDLEVGEHVLRLNYPGSDKYLSRSSVVNVEVVKKQALQLVDFAPTSVPLNTGYTITGRILDENDLPVKDKALIIFVPDDEGSSTGYSLDATTGNDGSFSASVNQYLPTSEGKRTISIICSADDSYKPLRESREISFVDVPTYTVTFIIENGAWDDDTAQKTVTLTYGSTIQATDLPVPKPDAGWGVGAWDTDPVGKSVTGNATYTWTYKHYKVSYVLVNADTAIGTAPAERGTQWWSTESREVIGGDALDLRPTVLDERYDFGGTWYSDQDCTQPAKAWAEVSGDVTLYGKWTGPYTLIEQVLLSFTPPAVGDPVPTGQYYADGTGDGLPSELGVTQPDSMDETTLVYHAAYELDGVEATSFQSGKTYTLRVIIDAVDEKTHRFKGHGGGPEYAITVTGAAGSLDYVSPTQTAVYLDFTPQQPQAPDSSVTVEITSNCEALYGFDGLPSYRFYDGDKIMLPIGDIITYSITVRSTGKDRADNIVIDIAVSNAFTLREGDLKQSIPPLGPGAEHTEHTVEIKLEIKRMPAAGETFDVTATAQWDGMQAPASETNKLKVRYSIITSAEPEEGGSITAPLLGVEGPQTISYAPNQGYRLKSLTIDGRALSLINGFLHITETLDGQALSVSDYPSSYTFTEITQNHLFTAEFAEAYDLTDVSVQQSGTLTYSGNPRTASVTASATAVNNETVTFSYSAEQNGPYTAEVPAFTNAGTYTVYYKASAADHNDAAGSFTVTVEPKTVTITVHSSVKRFGEADPVFTGTVTGLVDPDDLGTVSYVRTNSDEAVGDYPDVLDARYTDNKNYDVTVKKGDFKIAKAGQLYTVSVSASPTEGGTVSVPNGGTVAAGESVTVKATPNKDYVFVGWYKGTEFISYDNPCDYKPTGDVTLTARFIRVISSFTLPVTAPVKGEAPQSSITATDQYTGTISWSPDDSPFAASTAYTATVELKAKTGHEFDADAVAGVDGAGAVDCKVSSDGSGMTITAAFPRTADKDVPTVSADDITVTYTRNPVADSQIQGVVQFGGVDVPGSWAFKPGETRTDVAHSGTKTVVFTPDDDANYATVETTLKLTINKADPTVTGVSATAPATVYDTTAIGDIVLGFTADPSGGSITLDDGQTLEVGEKDYNWTYTPKDSDIANYNTATGKVSITVEKKTNPPQPSTISYAAKDGSGNTIQSVTWQKGSGKNLDLTFKRSEDDHLTYGLFGSLEIGGVTVGSANYGAAEGSLKLSIKPEYLETLDVGDHTVKVNFQDGSATVKLTVKAAAAQPQKPGETPASPKTGDESNLALWGSLMFLSFAAMNVLLLYARKRKIEE